MEIVYWALGYISCGILFMCLAPLIVWLIDKCEVEKDTFFEKPTYGTKWNYMYSDFPKSIVVLFWPFFVVLFFIFTCENLCEMITYYHGKKQKYIDYVNKEVARIMEE
jgi:TRAP-type C4-dicarboxylate transport system permease small subunit